MHNQVLDSVSSARYLGVDLPTNFNNYIHRICSNANKSLGFMKRNIRTKHPGVHEVVYKNLVCPQLEYGSAEWNPYTHANIHKVEMVQRRAVRWTLCNYSRYDSVTEMQTSLGWRPLEQRRTDARLCMLSEIVNGIVAIPLPPYFQQPTRMTHHSHPSRYGKFIHELSFISIHSSPWLLCSGTDYRVANVVLLPTLAQFSVAVKSLDHPMP